MTASPEGTSDGVPSAPTRARRLLVWGLVAIATLIAFISVAATWVDRQMLDNNAWENASRKVVEDSEVRAALATYLVNQLYTNVDVPAALAERLPADQKGLAAPLATALRQPLTRSTELLLARPRIQQLWINASTKTHEKLVNVLENKTGFGISTGEGVVTLDLHELVVQIGQDLGISQSALDKLPNKTGTVTLMSSDQLSAAQAGVRAVRIASVWLLVIVLGLYAVAIYLAKGARREALRTVGWAFVVVGLAVLVLRRVAGNYVIDTLSSPGYTGSVHRLWLIGTEILGEIGIAAVLYGVLAVLAATLAGPSKPALWVRGAIAPVLDRRPGMVAVVLGSAYLLLVLWGPTHALRKWWGVLLFGALLAFGTILLRRQTHAELEVAEAHEAEMAVSQRARVAESAAGEPPANGVKTRADEIARLAALRESGALSEDEFARAKALVLT